MIKRKPKTSPLHDQALVDSKPKDADQNWKAYLSEAKGLERDYLSEILKSRKNARIFGVTGFAFGLLMFGWHLANPITNVEPYILRVNNVTGAVDVVNTIKNQTVSQGEVVDKYWVSNYIRNYESYSHQSIQYNYDSTLLMSSKLVGSDYSKIYDKTNGSIGRDQLLGIDRQRTVHIVSITLDSKVDGLAVVRFETRTTGESQPESWIATMTYEYVKAAMSDQTRLINPLGFMVTSYRVEREILR